jgi:hypothetical protein
MTRAGHAHMGTTKRYLHFAGTVFRDEATALEARLLGGGLHTAFLYRPERISGDFA